MRQLRSARRTRLALILAVLTTPAIMSAQTAPLTIPGGVLRVSLGAGMDTWNDVLPGPGQPVAIDAAQATRLTGSLGLAIGLTSRFTLFGSVPFERMRVQATATEAGVDIPGDRAAGPGDAAAGIAWRIAGAAPDRVEDGARIEAAALARFPTGRVLRSAQYYTLTSGDGQTDVELAGRVHLPAGRVGLRLDGSYVLPFGETHAGLDPDPYFTVAASPWLRLGRRLAVEGVLEQLVRDDGDGGSATSVGGGVAYYSPGGVRGGRRSMPMAASWRVSRVVSAADGAPEPFSVSATIQLYYGLFR